MQPKKVTLNEEARDGLMNGINIVANAVKTTLGAAGKYVVLERMLNPAYVTKDGVTIAKEIFLEDRLANQGANLIKHAALSTNSECGDGTTTSTVLAQSLCQNGLDAVGIGGYDSTVLTQGFEIADAVVQKCIKERAKKISDDKEIKQVATISANNDEEIGNLITRAIKEIGKDGTFSIQEGTSNKLELETVLGFKFPRGYAHPYFATHVDKNLCVYENAKILLVDDELGSFDNISHLVEKILQQGSPFIIIAAKFHEPIINALAFNKMKGSIKCVCVEAPGIAEQKKVFLDDVAVLTGAKVFRNLSNQINNANLSDLGTCKKLYVSNTHTHLIDCGGNQDEIDATIHGVQESIKNCESDFEKERLNERLGALLGKAAIIRVGGQTETEINEKKDRVEDSLNATKAAMEEGILPGGGCALFYIAQELLKYNVENLSPGQIAGINIVMDALASPINQILKNADLDPKKITADLLKQKDLEYGYDVFKRHNCNMINQGIIDPAKVVRVSFEKALSVAKTVLRVEASVVTIPETDGLISMQRPQF